MIVDIEKIKSGKLNDKIVWVCGYMYNDYYNKPIRHIKPTKTKIRCNSKIKKRIIKSESHFVKINMRTNDISKSTIYSLYNNTGMYNNIPLNVFDNEKECWDCYNKLCSVIIENFKIFKENIIYNIDEIIIDIKDQMKK